VKPVSMRTRLTLWFSCTVGVLLSLSGLVYILSTRSTLGDRALSELVEELGEIAREARQHQTKSAFLPEVTKRFYDHGVGSKSERVQYEFVVNDDRDRRVFKSSKVSSNLLEHLQARHGCEKKSLISMPDTEDGNLLACFDWIETEFGRLEIIVVTSAARLNRDVANLYRSVCLAVPVAFFLAGLVGYWISGRAMSPVTHLAEQAASLSINSLHRRVKTSNPHDEVGKLADRLNTLISGLQTAVGEIRRFTADASHELRTPLAVIRIEAELAMKRERTREEYQRSLRVILQQVERLIHLAGHMLDLSRSEAGISLASHELVDFSLSLCRIGDGVKALGQSQGITVTLDVEPELFVRGDRLRVEGVISNLLANAVKYTQNGGEVKVLCNSDGDSLLLCVEDNGIGISADHLPKIFDRFYRVESSRNSSTGGAGLGLSIVRAVVASLGGTIKVTSELGSGTVVRVNLPLAVLTAGEPEAAQEIDDCFVVPNAAG